MKQTAGPRILNVDDSDEGRFVLSHILAKAGFEVSEAADGASALQLAAERPDMILLDLKLPAMDGFEVCRRIKADPRTATIPVLHLSAIHADSEHQAQGLDGGADGYLTQPVKPQVLVATVRALLRLRSVEAALAASEDRYRDLVENSQDLICTHDLEGRLLSVNATAARVTGYSREALLTMNLADLISPNARDGFATYLEKIRTKGAASGQMCISTKAGKTRWWEYHNTLRTEGVADPLVRAMAQDITERKQMEEALAKTEARFRATFEQVAVGIAHLAPDGRWLRVNQKLCEIIGYTREELLVLRFQDITHPDDLDRDLGYVAELLAAKRPNYTMEKRYRHKNGSVVWINLTVTLICTASGEPDYFISVIEDISERKAAAAKIERQTTLYAALSQCNEAIVRCTSEKELFAQVCRVAVECGGMKMAWIGLIDPDTRTIRPVASCGEPTGKYLQGIEISVDEASPYGRGMAGIAIRENQPVWCQDLENDPRTAPWRALRAPFGWGSSATLPLRRNAVPVGVFILNAGEVGAFDDAGRALLTEMATDVSFALNNFAREAVSVQAQLELREAEEQFRGLVEQSIAGIFIIQEGKFVYVNPRAVEIIGQDSAEELTGSDPLRWIAETDRPGVAENMRRLFEGEAQSLAIGFRVLHKDGFVIQVGANCARATHKGRRALIGMVQDISEKKRAEDQIQSYVAQLETAFMSTVKVATTLGEMRDPYTAGHQRRVAEVAVAIGAELGFDARRQEGLRVAGYLHDIGKITIPAEILSKPSKLSAIEFQLIQGHPQASYEVLKNLEFPWPIADVARQHHERMDGSGYPQGLKGEAILFEARILAVADVVEAMSSHRPYRPGLGIDKSLAEIERGRGTAYDTDVADACLKLFREKRWVIPA